MIHRQLLTLETINNSINLIHINKISLNSCEQIQICTSTQIITANFCSHSQKTLIRLSLFIIDNENVEKLVLFKWHLKFILIFNIRFDVDVESNINHSNNNQTFYYTIKLSCETQTTCTFHILVLNSRSRTMRMISMKCDKIYLKFQYNLSNEIYCASEINID